MGWFMETLLLSALLFVCHMVFLVYPLSPQLQIGEVPQTIGNNCHSGRTRIYAILANDIPHGRIWQGMDRCSRQSKNGVALGLEQPLYRSSSILSVFSTVDLLETIEYRASKLYVLTSLIAYSRKPILDFRHSTFYTSDCSLAIRRSQK